jgi:hypothetical protein
MADRSLKKLGITVEVDLGDQYASKIRRSVFGRGGKVT